MVVSNTADVVTLMGKVGNPSFSETSGTAFWRAGIGIPNEVGPAAFVWYSIKAWKGTAQHAAAFQRGDMIRATGRWVEETYTNKAGNVIPSRCFHAFYVELCDQSGS